MLAAEDLSGFYESYATICFTVLAVWLVAAEFMGARPRGRWDWRLGHAIALQMAVLGAMSLLAQVGIEDGAVWRVAFALGGVLSAVLVYGRAVRGRTDPLSVPGLTGWGMVALDLAVALAAFLPRDALSDMGSSLSALDVEAILLSVLVLLAVNLGVWLIFDHRDDGAAAGPE